MPIANARMYSATPEVKRGDVFVTSGAGGLFRPGDIVVLVGPLGAGMTALTLGIVVGLGVGWNEQRAALAESSDALEPPVAVADVSPAARRRKRTVRVRVAKRSGKDI